jgi:hypothetical protein
MSRTPRPVNRKPDGRTVGQDADEALAMAARLSRRLDTPTETVLPERTPSQAIGRRSREHRLGPHGQVGEQTASGKGVRSTPELRKGVDVGTPTECQGGRAHRNVTGY